MARSINEFLMSQVTLLWPYEGADDQYHVSIDGEIIPYTLKQQDFPPVACDSYQHLSVSERCYYVMV